MLLYLFTFWTGCIKRCTYRCTITHKSTYSTERTPWHTSLLPVASASCIRWTHTSRCSAAENGDELIALKVSFHIDLSAQIAVWASRTRLFNAISVLFISPEFFWSRSGEVRRTADDSQWVHAGYCCLLSATETASEGDSIPFFWPVWWLREQTRRVTWRVQTQVVHQIFFSSQLEVIF